MVSVECERTLIQASIVPGVVGSHVEAAAWLVPTYFLALH